MKPRFAKPLQIIALSLASANLAHADSATWNGTTDAAWATSTNWSSDPNPVPGTGNTATFNNAGGLDDVIDLGAGVTISSIIFDTVDVAAYTIGSGGISAQSLTLNDSGSIGLNSGVNAIQTIHSNIVLGGDGSAQNYTVFNNDPSSDPVLETISLVLAGTISGGSGGIAGPKVLNIDSSSNQRFAVSFKGAISNGGAGSLAIVKTGSGAIDFSGAVHTFTGGVSVRAGTFLLSAGTVLPAASVVSLGSSGNTGDAVTVGVVNAATNPTAALEVVEQTSGAPTTRVLSAPYPTSGRWSGPITMNDDLTVSASNLAFTLQSGATVNLNSNTLTLANSSSSSVSANGIISGAGEVVVNNTSTGTATLGAVNTFTGNLEIQSGILNIGASGAIGADSDTPYPGDISISNANTGGLINASTINQTWNGVISGAGIVTKTGSATLTFGGPNTYSGATAVQRGILTVASGGSITPGTGARLTLGSGSSGNGAVTFNYNSALTSKFNDIRVGDGNDGTGNSTLNQTAGIISANSLSMNNGFTGGGAGDVNLSGGAMNITNDATISNQAAQNSGVTPVSTFTISNNASLTVGGNLRLTGNASSSGVARHAHGVFIQDGGTVTATGTNGLWLVQGFSVANTNTRRGVYDLNGGTLTASKIHSNSNSATDAVATFNFNGGTLKPTASTATFWVDNAQTTANVKDGGAFIDTNNFDITISQPLLKFAGSTTDSLTKSGLGTLTLAGTNTYTGGTTVTGGTLAVNGTSLDDAGRLVINGGVVAPTGTETVNSLYFGGTPQAAGTWGATGSGATNIDDSRFSGTAGVISVTTLGAPLGFAGWVSTPAFGLAVGDQDPTDDPDNDGMDNLLEFALNGNPATSDPSIMPDLVVTASNFEFTYQRRDDSVSPETTQTFQWGSTLATWPGSVSTSPPLSSPSATVTITPGLPFDSVTDTVKISIPKSEAGGTGKLFGRLQVTKP